MEILQLCKKFPFPLKDGESLAVNYLSKSLNELDCKITLLAMNTSKHQYDFVGNEKDLYHYQDIHSVYVNNDITYLGALQNLFTSLPFHVTRYHSEAFKQKLIDVLKESEFDVIQLETLYLCQYIPVISEYSKAIIALRSHNVEFEIWERVTNNTKSILKRKYLHYLTKKLKKYELDQLKNIDHLLAITKRDLKTFRSMGYLNSAACIPIGLDTSDYMAVEKNINQNVSLSFIGSLDWVPNTEALEWFLRDIWPGIRKQFPNITFHVAGRNTPNWYFDRNLPNVYFHGEVDDAKKFINQHPIMVVPLLSGSGMRVKILEGLFLGRIVISTSLGLEGIEAKHKNQVLIAETSQEFRNMIQFCLNHPLQTNFISKRAMVFASKYYDNLEIGKELLSYYKQQSSQIFEKRTIITYASNQS